MMSSRQGPKCGVTAPSSRLCLAASRALGSSARWPLPALDLACFVGVLLGFIRGLFIVGRKLRQACAYAACKHLPAKRDQAGRCARLLPSKVSFWPPAVCETSPHPHARPARPWVSLGIPALPWALHSRSTRMNDTAAAPRSAYDFEATSITGQAVPLSDYRGKVLLRSEEHTSELQSPCNLVCRLLLEKKTK